MSPVKVERDSSEWHRWRRKKLRLWTVLTVTLEIKRRSVQMGKREKEKMVGTGNE
jgi:hypothetical protein